MKVFYSDHYTLPLPEGHRFPMGKYRQLRDYLLHEKILSPTEFEISPLATEAELHLAHTPTYVREMRDGTVAIGTIKRIGFPWSFELYQRSRATVGGALAAAKVALNEGLSGNLAGGTHHAHADRGEGYCVFNDLAVASRWLVQNQIKRKIAIIDLDVHQGNGNSSILHDDPEIFVFSMHGIKNYPFVKVPSSLDIALPDGANDALFLAELRRGMEAVENFGPDFIFYQMGVDPLKEDRLGRMNLTWEGLARRDEVVLSFARSHHIPVSLALGGGYAEPIELSVRAYANTYRVAKRLYPSV